MKKVLGIFAAMNSVGLGIALFLQCGLGGDSVAVFCEGLQVALEIRFGHASLIFNLVMILISWIVSRKNIGMGTMVYALGAGYFIDFYSWILSPLHLQLLHMCIRLFIHILGMLLFALALAILIHFQYGMNAIDAILYKITDKFAIPYNILRTIFDVIAVIAGYVLGGTVGIGTILCALATGTLVKKFVSAMSIVWEG